jgi:hypothetical protein
MFDPRNGYLRPPRTANGTDNTDNRRCSIRETGTSSRTFTIQTFMPRVKSSVTRMVSYFVVSAAADLACVQAAETPRHNSGELGHDRQAFVKRVRGVLAGRGVDRAGLSRVVGYARVAKEHRGPLTQWWRCFGPRFDPVDFSWALVVRSRPIVGRGSPDVSRPTLGPTAGLLAGSATDSPLAAMVRERPPSASPIV